MIDRNNKGCERGGDDWTNDSRGPRGQSLDQCGQTGYDSILDTIQLGP